MLTPPRLDEAAGRDPAVVVRASRRSSPRVERVKEYILAGDAFQVVLSQRFAEPAAGARPLDVYRALRVINPSPYMFHLEFPEARVTGASPETLVRLSRRPRRAPADRRHAAARRAPPPRTIGSRPSCSPIPRSAPST